MCTLDAGMKDTALEMLENTQWYSVMSQKNWIFIVFYYYFLLVVVGQDIVVSIVTR